jgi:predicted O-linked N-acetylglucosamine transferase (SPINDLY family)
VQVSWLGYLGTTGMTRVHYRLCDHYTDPAGAELFHTEKLVRLPDSQWCYRPRESVDYTICEVPPVVRNGFITFGSFNNVPKISSSTLGTWTEVLTQSSDARLVLIGVPEGRARRDIMQHLSGAGISVSRITVVARVSLQEYFSWFNQVDVALDTTPYSGGTTTCDAIWMGVPVITFTGPRSISRSAGSILSAMGLTEWSVSTPEDYVRLAIRHARGNVPLALSRKVLRQKMRESPLMNELRFARNIEHAYRTMWRAWCVGDQGI